MAEESLHGPKRPLYEAVEVKPGLHWKPHNVIGNWRWQNLEIPVKESYRKDVEPAQKRELYFS